MQYLRHLCQENQFAKNELIMFDKKIGAVDIETPVFAISCETDHIASWKDSFRGLQNFSSKEKVFVLSEAGHVAGIINAPDRNKYGYYFRKDDVKDPEQWKIGAEFVKESWWPFWERWLREKSEDLVGLAYPTLVVNGFGRCSRLLCSPKTTSLAIKIKYAAVQKNYLHCCGAACIHKLV